MSEYVDLQGRPVSGLGSAPGPGRGLDRARAVREANERAARLRDLRAGGGGPPVVPPGTGTSNQLPELQLNLSTGTSTGRRLVPVLFGLGALGVLFLIVRRVKRRGRS